jgi:hypothetical protein
MSTAREFLSDGEARYGSAALSVGRQLLEDRRRLCRSQIAMWDGINALVRELADGSALSCQSHMTGKTSPGLASARWLSRITRGLRPPGNRSRRVTCRRCRSSIPTR